MCLYPKKYINKKYIATEKNGGNIPKLPIVGYQLTKTPNGNYIDEPIYDTRVKEIEIPCGQCIECRQKKAAEWRVRLTEEIKEHKYNYFITYTFDPLELQKICDRTHQAESNYIVGWAIRHYLERWRKDYKCSQKHWFITELGHDNTERIHIHGLIFSDNPLNTELLQKYWKYGGIWIGDYCNNKTINYIVKYVTKIDNDHKSFHAQIFSSPGLGKNWIQRHMGEITYTYRPHRSRTDYILPDGKKIALPTYYKNYLYNEEDREKIWRDFMDKDKVTILGNDYSISVKNDTLARVSKKANEINNFNGYGNASKEWRKQPYNITERMLRTGEKRAAELKKTRLNGEFKEWWQNYYEKNA